MEKKGDANAAANAAIAAANAATAAANETNALPSGGIPAPATGSTKATTANTPADSPPQPQASGVNSSPKPAQGGTQPIPPLPPDIGWQHAANDAAKAAIAAANAAANETDALPSGGNPPPATGSTTGPTANPPAPPPVTKTKPLDPEIYKKLVKEGYIIPDTGATTGTTGNIPANQPAPPPSGGNATPGQTQWINSATGKPVPANDIVPRGAQLNDPRDPNHAFIPSGPTVPGTDYVRLPDNSWINSATGKPVPVNDLVPRGARLNDPRDTNHAFIPSGPTVPGTDYVRVPLENAAAPTVSVLPGTPAACAGKDADAKWRRHPIQYGAGQ